MGIDITDPRVHELARAAAEATGQTQTSAVVTALELYLAQVGSAPAPAQAATDTDRDARIEEILNEIWSITRRDPVDPHALIEDLYDAETGLPR